MIADALSHHAHDANVGIQVNVLMDIDHSEAFLEDVRSLLQQNFSKSFRACFDRMTLYPKVNLRRGYAIFYGFGGCGFD